MFLLFLLLESCLNNNTDKKYKGESPDHVAGAVDSITFVTFEKGYTVIWKNLTSQFVEDSSYFALKSRVTNNKMDFVKMILDSTETNAVACSYKLHLAKGDLAFIILHKLYNLPLFEIYESQLDVLKYDCPYPDGMFELLHKERKKIYENTRIFFNS